MLAHKDGASVRLISRNAVDWTYRFRELAAAIAKLRTDILVHRAEDRRDPDKRPHHDCSVLKNTHRVCASPAAEVGTPA
jgi:hypothetical protein